MSHRIRIACSKENLKEIRVFVSETLKTMSVPELEVSMIVLAVDEVCANRIIHSNQNNSNCFLELLIFKSEADCITFEIIDDGDPFDHLSYIEPNISNLVKERKKGGLGLMLVKKIMDSFEVKRVNNHTVCKLTKRLKLTHS